MTTHRTFSDLESAALDAHRSGRSWASFWPTIESDARRLAGASPRVLNGMYQHLLHLAVSGDGDGQQPPGSCGWEQQ